MVGGAEGGMQIGIMMRTWNPQASGGQELVRWSELKDIAVLAEDVGIDTLSAPDHLLFRNAPPMVMPEGATSGVWEVFTLLSALAAVTRRVTLLPLVACTGFRNPALLAKIADSLDEVSDGRLLLGLGAGWHEPEYTAYGYPFDHRVSRFEEALQIIIPMLKGESVTHSGRHYEVNDAVLVPRGPRPGGPPIWIGARKPRMLGLVAKYADAYNTDMLLSFEGTTAAEGRLGIVDEACRTAGRDPSTLRKTAGCMLAVEGFDQVAGGISAPILRGSNEQIVELLAAHAAIGIDHFTFWLNPFSARAVEQLAPIVEAAHKL